MTRVLVTGGSGRVGSNLVSLLLEKGYFVHSLDLIPPPPFPCNSSTFRFFQGSVTSMEDLKAAVSGGVNIIFHIASQIDLAPSCTQELWDTNVNGTANVIAACIQFDITTLVYTSTLDVTWDWKGLSGPETCDYPKRPSNGYILTKGIAEKMVLDSNGKTTCLNNILHTVALRPVHIYGPGDILALSALEMAGSIGFVPKYGKGKTDFIYVRNVAHGHILAAERLIDGNDDSPVAGSVYYLKDDFKTSYVDAMYQFTKVKYPAVKQFYIPYWLIAFCGLIMTFIYAVIYRLGFHPEYKFSYWHVKLTSGVENVSAVRSKTELGYYQLVPTSQGLAETHQWIRNLP